MQFLGPTINFTFKKIFGSPASHDILLSFLNAVLAYQSPIIQVEIQFPCRRSKINGMTDSFIDVRATDECGTQCAIEMHVFPVPDLEQRILLHACETYADQIKKSDDDRLGNDVIVLTVTDFILFDHPDMISKFKLRDESGRDYSDDLELIFVELPKFTKQEADLTDSANLLDKWCYFLRYAQNLAEVPAVLAQEPPIEHAFAIANRASLAEDELEMQERREMFIQDLRGALEKAKADGYARGIKQAIANNMAQGAAMKAIAIAQNLKTFGLGNDQIAQFTGLSLADVAKLQCMG